jgi:hypothetical protein
MMRLAIRLSLVMPLALLPAVASAEPAARPVNYGMTQTRIIGGRDPRGYTAAVISPGWHDNNPEAETIAREGHDWLISRFKAEYPQLDSAFFDAMKLSNHPLDERSFFIVLFRGTDRSDIQATLRYSFTTPEKPWLPPERELGWTFPRPSVTAGPYPTVLEGKLMTFPEVQGQVLSIENLARAKDATDDVIPALFHTAETEMNAHFGMEAMKYHASHLDPVHRVRTYDPRRLRPDLDLTRVPIRDTMPVLYGGYCDRVMLPHYLGEWGFKLARPEPLKGHLFAIYLDRQAYVDMLMKFKARPGGAMVGREQIVSYGSENQLSPPGSPSVRSCLRPLAP